METQNQSKSVGCLSQETRTALKNSTYAIVEIANYYFEELGFNYFLPGKVQTDLEARFGHYRRLCGSVYHVTLR